jgi:hypothetical protein
MAHVYFPNHAPNAAGGPSSPQHSMSHSSRRQLQDEQVRKANLRQGTFWGLLQLTHADWTPVHASCRGPARQPL